MAECRTSFKRLVGTVASELTAGNATLINSIDASATFDLDADV